MILRAWPALLVSLALLVGACETQTPAVYTTGVEGQVTVGPMCPVVREGEPCPDRPYAANLVVRSADGSKVVAEDASGGAGLYRIPLEPGRYVLVARSPEGGPLPSASPVDFEVPAEGFVTVDIAFDSGIR